MELSFYKTGQWKCKPTGVYSQDCQRGREMAEEMLRKMRDEEVPAMLFYIIEAMPRAPEYRGIRTGFLHVIGLNAIEGLPE